MNIKRGQKFFPQLSGLQAKINEVAEPVTDRGLTGPAARDAEDVQKRLEARKAKLERRAKNKPPYRVHVKRARISNQSECLDCAYNPGLCDTHNSEDKT